MTRDLKILSFSLLLWGFGEGLFLFFQPLILQQMGADPIVIGTILGTSAFATGIAQIPLGRLSDHIGARPFLWGSWVLGTLATILVALSFSMTGIIIGMVLYGLSGSIMAPLNSYYSSIRGKLSLQKVITTVTSSYYLGAIAGPSLGGFIAVKTNLKSVYVFAAGIFILSTLIVLFIQHYPPTLSKTNPSKLKTKHFSRSLIVFIFTIFLILLVTNLSIPLTPNFLQTIKGLSYAQSGILGTMVSVGYILMVNLVGRLNQKTGLLLSIAGVFIFSLFIWISNSYIIFIAVYLFACSPRVVRSLSAAFARPFLHEARIGTGYGLLETSNSFAFMISPILAGFIVEINPELIYPISMFLSVVAFIFVLAYFNKIN